MWLDFSTLYKCIKTPVAGDTHFWCSYALEKYIITPVAGDRPYKCILTPVAGDPHFYASWVSKGRVW